MARVMIGVLQRKEAALYEHIDIDRKQKHITGQMMAEVLGYHTRQAYQTRFNRKAFTIRELLLIMAYLGWTDDEILYYLGTRAGKM